SWGCRVWVERVGKERKDGAGCALGFHAVFIFGLSQGRHALEIDDSGQVLAQLGILLGLGTDAFEHVRRLARFPLVKVQPGDIDLFGQSDRQRWLAGFQRFFELADAAVAGVMKRVPDVFQRKRVLNEWTKILFPDGLAAVVVHGGRARYIDDRAVGLLLGGGVFLLRNDGPDGAAQQQQAEKNEPPV